MKNFRTISLYSICILLLVMMFTSCKKGDEGKTGSTGATGATGTPGTTGPAGLAGIDGNTMLNGTGAPADTIGVVGDFYLDMTDEMLYGPKASTGWGTGVSIKGASGSPGKDAQVMVDTFMITNDNWNQRDIYSFAIEFGQNTAYNWPGMFYDRYNPNITKEIIETGVVIVDVLVSPNADPFHRTPLPFSAYAGTYDMNLDYRLDEGGVEVVYYLTSNANGAFPSHGDVEDVTLPDYQVKVITIPATMVTVITRVMKEQKEKVKAN